MSGRRAAGGVQVAFPPAACCPLPADMAKILIVDDERSIRGTLAKILEDEGHRTAVCESGEEALAQFARERRSSEI